MTLTPPDVASIARRLSFWEIAEYASETLVALGCFGEYVAEYTKWLATEDQRLVLGKRSLVVLILGISFGLLALIQTNALSGRVIGSLGEQSEEASRKSAKAITDSDNAMGKAKTSLGEADAAKTESDKAKFIAGQAESVAHSARLEADAFKDDIAAAKSQATRAETRLSEEIQKRIGLEGQLSWRDLTLEKEVRMAQEMSRFSGQLFDITTYPNDPEPLNFANELYSVVMNAKWILDPGKMTFGLAGLVVGIEIARGDKSPSSTISAAEALLAMLQREGVAVNPVLRVYPNAEKPQLVFIHVGLNPNRMHPIITAK